MTKEEIKEAAEVMQAYADGKEIEYYVPEDGEWYTVAPSAFNWDKDNYRIKKEPTYRPFKNKEECWSEIQKHQPLLWVLEDNTKFTPITAVDDIGAHVINFTYYYDMAFESLKFADGTPFGFKEN